jgi:hypothetical protein
MEQSKVKKVLAILLAILFVVSLMAVAVDGKASTSAVTAGGKASISQTAKSSNDAMVAGGAGNAHTMLAGWGPGLGSSGPGYGNKDPFSTQVIKSKICNSFIWSGEHSYIFLITVPFLLYLFPVI